MKNLIVVCFALCGCGGVAPDLDDGMTEIADAGSAIDAGTPIDCAANMSTCAGPRFVLECAGDGHHAMLIDCHETNTSCVNGACAVGEVVLSLQH